MIGVVFIIFVAVTAIALARMLDIAEKNSSATKKKRRLLRELRKADERIGKEANQARRAMNDAAGQSWRNRFE